MLKAAGDITEGLVNSEGIPATGFGWTMYEALPFTDCPVITVRVTEELTGWG